MPSTKSRPSAPISVETIALEQAAASRILTRVPEPEPRGAITMSEAER